MLNVFYGKKLRQTQEFTESGKRIPVTEVETQPLTVVQIKNSQKEGYWALQVGFDHKTAKRTTKPLKGHLKKTGQGNFLPRFLREIRLSQEGEFKVGDKITADQVFASGDLVKVTGVSKAKGFQGGVKRHGFKGGPRTHGQSDRERAPGSIGQTTTPGRVYKGKRMAGHMGNAQITVSGLKIVRVDLEKQRVYVAGLIPGGKNTVVTIQKES